MTFAQTIKRLALCAPIAAVLAGVAANAAFAQAGRGPPNALQGFSQNRGQPINISSVSLEVRDKEKIATFIDSVRLIQGDTVLECKKLIVFYDEEVVPAASGSGAPRAKPASTGAPTQGGQQIRRLEAKGGVVVTQKDQTAVGDDGIYDMQSNNMILIGNVVVTQGQNVIRGDRLTVDLVSGVSLVESAAGNTNRVQGVFLPSQPAPAAAAPATAAKPKPAHGSTPRGATNSGRAQRNSEKDKGKQQPQTARPMQLN